MSITREEYETVLGDASRFQSEMRRLEGIVRTLRAELERKDAALLRWQNYGCPDCGGDCSAANPPVACCIMQETSAALTATEHKEGNTDGK